MVNSTGSMSAVWNAAKSSITEMVKRIVTIGGIGKSELQWVGYRDYSDKAPTPILEQSVWTSNAEVLQAFINKIVCTGGGDAPEAVEKALEFANNSPDVTRVILIGDAPPHMEGKGNLIAAHKVVLSTDYKEQVCSPFLSPVY